MFLNYSLTIELRFKAPISLTATGAYIGQEHSTGLWGDHIVGHFATEASN